MSDSPCRPDGIQSFIHGIRTAWYAGRRVVPLVGAGLSADSGIPVIRSLVRYFCKFHQYIHHRAYLPAPRGAPGDPLAPFAARYQTEPWKYVSQFGWPDRFDLNQDLLAVLEAQQERENGPIDRPLVDAAVRSAYDSILRDMNPDAYKVLDDLRKAITDRCELPAPLAASVDQRFVEDGWGGNVPFQLFGDWRKVIQHFTHYQGEYADVLFNRLCGGRRPSLGHRFLAFLIKLLAVRTVFTFNFDDLIERALRAEGVDHLTFAMEHGSGLPHPALVRDVTAVVKMHGSTHALLLDERLDRPLGDEYKRRFLDLIGPNPFLLVIGCSGGDNRLRDLLDHIVRFAPGGAEVGWVHFEQKEPSVLTKFRADIGQANQHRAAPGGAGGVARLLTTTTNNLGLTLQHMHAALVGRHPASTVPYVSHINRPFRLGPLPFPELAEARPTEANTFVVLSSIRGAATGTDRYPVRTASEALVDLAAHWTRRGWQPIWVDLESAHTLAAVIGSIVDQCRAVDATLTPSVLPITDQAGEVRVMFTSARRVAEALRRSRYIVLFDGLEAYPWPPTTHHGETVAGRVIGDGRLDRLWSFLLALSANGPPIGESKVVLGVDQSKARSSGGGAAADRAQKYLEFIDNLSVAGPWHLANVALPAGRESVRFADTFRAPRAGATGKDACHPFITPNPAGPHAQALWRLLPKLGPDDHPTPDYPAQAWGIAFLMLSTVRRARHLVTVRHLLRLVFNRGEAVDEVLARVTAGELGDALGMTRLEGGGLWYHRPVRDYVYAENARYAGTGTMTACLTTDSADPAHMRMAAAQTFVLAIAHQRVARMYYTYTFVQSDDATSFLEYLYHRVSSVRYFAKLLALLDRESAVSGYAGCASGGVSDALDALRAGLSKRGWKQLWRGIETEGALREVINSDRQSRTIGVCQTGIRDQQEREIASLSRAWVRAEPVLRTQLPAEQLIFWAEALLRDDIPGRMNAVVVRPALKEGDSADPDAVRERVFPEQPTGVNPEAQPHVVALAEVVADFVAKLKYERADSEGVAADRWAVLKAARDQGGNKPSAPPHRWAYLTPRVDDVPDRPTHPLMAQHFLDLIPPPGQRGWLRLAHLHYLLDAAACLTKRAQERVQACGQTYRLLKVVKERLEEIDQAPGGLDAVVQTWTDWPPDQAAANGDYHEAWMRYYYLAAEALLRDVSVFSQPIGFIGQPPDQVKKLKRVKKRMTIAQAKIERGLTHLREQTPRADGRLRSLTLDPTADGSLYIPYRAAFYSLYGRVQWMQAVRDEAITGKPELLDDEFERAFQSFDMAVGGLRHTNHQVAAQNELYRVEACLARARIALHHDAVERLAGGGEDGVGKVLDLATSKYESARVGLQRARAHLQTGRRNVIWWKLFYALAAQYHADRLSVAVAHLLRDWPARAPESGHGLTAVVKPAEAFSRLRRGYAAVRSGLDLREPAPRVDANWPWLRRVWREMTLSGYVIGRLLLRHALRSGAVDGMKAYADPHAQHDYACHVLRWLNQSARLLRPVDDFISGPETEIRTVLEAKDAEPSGSNSEPSIIWVRVQLGRVLPEDQPEAPPPSGLDALKFRVDLLSHARDRTQ